MAGRRRATGRYHGTHRNDYHGRHRVGMFGGFFGVSPYRPLAMQLNPAARPAFPSHRAV